MQPSSRVGLLTHIIRCDANVSGFTLLELIVVITIVGVLSAISVPIFAGQINKAREAEAKTYVGAINRAQQMHYMDNQEFSETPSELGSELPNDATSYLYEISRVEPAGERISVMARVDAKPHANSGARGFTGWVWIEQDSTQSVVRSLLCEGKPNTLPSLDLSTMKCVE